MIRIALTATVLLLSAIATQADAQSLGGGDYERCAVYRPNGTLAGYSNACLERQRASIRRNTSRASGNYGYAPSTPAYGGQAAYPCPSWANNGRGYSSTTYSGSYGVRYGNFTSSVNGQPCTPNSGNQFLRGVN